MTILGLYYMSVPTSRTSQMYTAFTKLVRFAGSGGVVEGDPEDSQEDMIALNVRSTNNINFLYGILYTLLMD